MLIAEREKYVLQYLEEQSSVTVKQLSDDMNVSEVTVRKLLEQMEREGQLKRSWGGAVRIGNASQEFSYAVKSSRHLAEKRAIARAAYDLIKEDETIYIDTGTTSFELVKLIVGGNKRLSVCTNAFNILGELQKRSDIQAVMIGGELRPAIYSCVGMMTVKMLGMIIVDRAFITGDHYSIEHGFSVSHLQDAEVKIAVQKSGKRNYIVMDSSKFGDDSMAMIAEMGAPVTLITDWKLPKEAAVEIEKRGTQVILAPQV